MSLLSLILANYGTENQNLCSSKKVHFKPLYVCLINWNFSITCKTQFLFLFTHSMVYASCNLLLVKGFSYRAGNDNL